MANSHQEIDISITVQNTFVTLKSSRKEIADRRSSSVPRAFKPGDFCCTDSSPRAAESSDSSTCCESTSASDSEADNIVETSSDNESQDYHTGYCTDDDLDESDFVSSIAGALPKPATLTLDTMVFAEPKPVDIKLTLDNMVFAQPKPVDNNKGNKVTLTLDCMVSAEKPKRSKLKSAARPFVSSRTPPAEVTTLTSDVVRALSGHKDISEVQVRHGGMGGTTMIIVKSTSADPDARIILAVAKDTLLTSAEQSTSTYILGYGAQPFSTLDPLSFSASVAFNPPANQDKTCWDFYENGFCRRCSSCTWAHPSENDKMRLIVMVQKAA